MKKIIFLFAITLVWSFGLLTSEASAQGCTNPGGCIYGVTTVTINYSTHRVEGYSSAQADYTAGLNWNPRADGIIYRTDMNETNLDHRISTGNGSSVMAQIFLSTSNFVSGKTYCNYTNFFAILRSNGYVDYIGSLQDCKMIAAAPTPTPTPTATPTPVTPTPTPTPCLPLESEDGGSVGTCQDQIIISISISPQELKPVGTTGGNNTASVSGCLTRMPGNTPVSGQTVNLSVYRGAGDVNTGGHLDSAHTGTRPLGRLSKTTGTTGSNGCVNATYTPSHIAGSVTIQAYTSASHNESRGMLVRVPGLVELGGGTNYGLVGSTTSHPSPVNHFGTQATVTGMVQIADDYKAMFYGGGSIPENDKINYNDMSLGLGGKFDLGHAWSNAGAHAEHREGINDDVRCCTNPGLIPGSRWAALNQIFINRGSTRTNDETQTANPHWHLRFEFGTVQAAAPRTPNIFVEDSWDAVMARFATQAEWENWHTRIVAAKAQGPAQLLEEAMFFQQGLIAESEYVARHRTDEEFISDVFWSHFFRDPTPAESQSWQLYMQNLPPAYPLSRKRRNVLYQLEATQEFADLVSGMVD